jgi:extracellular elastinolytic metalloproteinase
MTREIDRRDFSVSRVTTARESALRSAAAEVSRRLSDAHRVRIAAFDETTGNPATVVSEAAPAERGNYVQRALDHVHRIAPALGLRATQAPEYAADPSVQQTSSGVVSVHLRQQYRGIPIFQSASVVRFAHDGSLLATLGSSVTVTDEPDAVPRLPVRDAVLRAAQHVAIPDADELEGTDEFGEPLRPASVDLAGFVPEVLAAFPDRTDQPTVLAAGPFGDQIKASLTWFPLDDELRLGWEAFLTMPGYTDQFRTIVDARTGEILYCHQEVAAVSARGKVFPLDGDGPRQMTDFPRPAAAYGLPLPADLPGHFPPDWVEADATAGSCVNAHAGDDGPPLRGSAGGGRLLFDPDPRSHDQRILNAFYLACSMHDHFYLLGFRERDGNFQQDDLGLGGVGGDRLDLQVHDGPIDKTASMATPVDGSSPRLRLGLATSTTRHTALDASVVIHEYAHGVSRRLVGGVLNDNPFSAPQSAGMWEGLSDYFACTVTGSTVVAAWTFGRPAGIRGFPYDGDYPAGFGDLGRGRYVQHHAVGEVIAAALLEMNRKIDPVLGQQLLVDAFKLCPANPSFLAMRDAILAAVDHKRAAGQLAAVDHAVARRGIWEAFARFGMGPGARCIGAQLTGIVSDTSLPDQPEAPGLVMPEGQPGGGTRAAPADLKRIKGIGPGIERSLHRAGIRTFTQLAALTPDDLVRLVGTAAGLSAQRIAKQDWTGAARELAAAEEEPAGVGGPEWEAPPDRQQYATFTVELLLDENGEVRRTRVVHVQQQDKDGGKDSWPGWEGGRLVRYFVEHAALPSPPPAAARLQAGLAEQPLTATGAAAEPGPDELLVEMSNITFQQVADAEGVTPGRERIRARVDFRLSGAGSQVVSAGRRTYFVNILAYAITTDETTVLAASHGHLRPGVLDYTSTVEFTPPGVGRYQLLGTVVVSEHNALGVAIGPRLRVVS